MKKGSVFLLLFLLTINSLVATNLIPVDRFKNTTIGNSEVDKILLEVAEAGTSEEIKDAIEAGANINVRDYLDTISTPLVIAVRHNSFDAMKTIIEAGASLEDAYPLYLAARWGYPSLVDFLLNYFDINSRTYYTGESVLFGAIFNNTYPELFYSLIERGAKVHIRDSEGNTILHCIAASPEADLEKIEYLISYVSLDANGRNININVTNADGESPLMTAAGQSSDKVIQFLLEKGADPLQVDNSGRNAFDHIEYFGNRHISNKMKWELHDLLYK